MVVFRIIIIYIIVFLVAAGIAILADRLGSRIGKRKLSIFNLRPRHTSTILTAVTGGSIAIATLTLAAILSLDIREAITGVETRLKELQERETYLNQAVDDLEEKMARGRIVWGYQEPIVLATLPANSNEERARALIDRLLTDSNAWSILKNNAIAKSRREELLPSDTRIVEMNDELLEEQMLKMVDNKENLGVELVAAQNCLYKDTVRLDITSFPVRKVYYKDDVVARLVIERNRSLVGWYSFLEEMRVSALRAGMIEINDSLGGGLTEQQLRKIGEKVDNIDTDFIEYQAVANRDLFQSSSLDISIKVTGIHR